MCDRDVRVRRHLDAFRRCAGPGSALAAIAGAAPRGALGRRLLDEGRLRRHLTQGPEEPGARLDRAEAVAAARDDRQPAGHRQRREGGEQPLLLDLRQIPDAVLAAEQIRRLVVAAQRGHGRVQALRGQRDGRRDASARRCDDQHQERPEAVRDEVEPLCDGSAEPGRRIAGEHAETGVGAERQRRHDLRPGPVRDPARFGELRGVRPAGSRRRRNGGRDADAHGHDQRGLRLQQLSLGGPLLRGAVPEPDPRRLRAGTAPGGRPAGPRRARRDPGRSARRGSATSRPTATASGSQARR